jgi:hypothetical protein
MALDDIEQEFFPSYPKMRRYKGGIQKALYDAVKLMYRVLEEPPSIVVVFKSAELTGTGAEESIPHDLGVAPSLVFVTPTNVVEAATFVEGTHGSANLKVNATLGAKYKVIAVSIKPAGIPEMR